MILIDCLAIATRTVLNDTSTIHLTLASAGSLSVTTLAMPLVSISSWVAWLGKQSSNTLDSESHFCNNGIPSHFEPTPRFARPRNSIHNRACT